MQYSIISCSHHAVHYIPMTQKFLIETADVYIISVREENFPFLLLGSGLGLKINLTETD